ncbi:MAG: putative chemotaxis protein methyltransferase, partial [Gemmatimonadetes bacterium]|nr:putative chemotaxis protein methyltransferase [Gemmatimonadota bacterium]
MRRAMAALRIDTADALRDAVQTRGDARDALLAELTVGESYFFRESGQLDILRTEILPELRTRRGVDRPLRLWSAGCASGEEPYTVAIMLREEGWPHPARLLATDVAVPRLDAARRRRYTKWALRGVSEQRIDRWFERKGALFQLDETIRAAVDFRPLNLIADDYPSPANATDAQDVILCRNVLIYFDMAAVERIAAGLLASLAPDGWLLLGASDPPLAGLVPCEVVLTSGGVAYRRADRKPDGASRTSQWIGPRRIVHDAPPAWSAPAPAAVEPRPARVPSPPPRVDA